MNENYEKNILEKGESVMSDKEKRLSDARERKENRWENLMGVIEQMEDTEGKKFTPREKLARITDIEGNIFHKLGDIIRLKLTGYFVCESANDTEARVVIKIIDGVMDKKDKLNYYDTYQGYPEGVLFEDKETAIEYSRNPELEKAELMMSDKEKRSSKAREKRENRWENLMATIEQMEEAEGKKFTSFEKLQRIKDIEGYSVEDEDGLDDIIRLKLTGYYVCETANDPGMKIVIKIVDGVMNKKDKTDYFDTYQGHAVGIFFEDKEAAMQYAKSSKEEL